MSDKGVICPQLLFFVYVNVLATNYINSNERCHIDEKFITSISHVMHANAILLMISSQRALQTLIDINQLIKS